MHVIAYLWSAAWCFFDEGDPAAERWGGWMTKARQILEGKAGIIAASIRRKATRLKLDPDKRKNADRVADDLLNKRAHLDYPTALATAGRSRPASSKASADTSSKTARTSQARAGDSTQPKPSRNSARSSATATSTPTGTFTSPKNAAASTPHATPSASSPSPPELPPRNLHPNRIPARPFRSPGPEADLERFQATRLTTPDRKQRIATRS